MSALLTNKHLELQTFVRFLKKIFLVTERKNGRKKRKETQKEVSTKTDVDENFDENKKSQNFESKNNFSLERKKNSATPFRCRLSSKKLS